MCAELRALLGQLPMVMACRSACVPCAPGGASQGRGDPHAPSTAAPVPAAHPGAHALGGLRAFPHAAVGLSARPHVSGGVCLLQRSVCPSSLPVFQPVLVCLSWRPSGSSRSLDGHPVLLVWFTHFLLFLGCLFPLMVVSLVSGKF